MTARCTMPGCPVRWREGDDRPCPDHRDDDQAALLEATEALGIDLTPPGRRRGKEDS